MEKPTTNNTIKGIKRVLLINDLAEMGGTEVQHWREYELLKSKGHEVFSLTFDENLPISNGPKYNIPINENNFQKSITRTFAFRYKKDIERVVAEVKPDVIHINNSIKAPLALYDCVKDYPCMQTIRDYAAICPKATCIHPDYSACKGRKFGNCKKCGLNLSQRVKLSFMNRIDARRKAACNVLVSPSQALASACTNNELPTECLNNPFDFNKVVDRHMDENIKTYLYYGSIAKIKGVSILLEAFKEFAKDKDDVKLVLAGRVTADYQQEFKQHLAEVSSAKYVGALENDDMLKLLASVYCVVVPSLWIENYPNTVLESLASGVLVIGSNRGGIPELIRSDERVFDVCDSKNIMDVLNATYRIEPAHYREIIEANKEFVLENNSLDAFYCRLVDMFSVAVARFQSIEA